MRIHKEGISTLITLLLFAAALIWISWTFNPVKILNWALSILLLIGFLFTLRFFRSPYRPIMADADAILAPADGLIVEVGQVFEPTFFREDVLRISIFMSGNDVHINWIPIDGEILYHSYSPGKHLLAKHPKSSELNESSTIVVAKSLQQKILIRQIAGIMARRVVTKVQPGDQLAQGDEFGFIKLGSRVEILLPATCKTLVQPGQKVLGRQTILANWP